LCVGKYRLRKKISSDSFGPGDIYLGINIISREEVDIKLESVKAKHPQLEYESKVYKTLAGGIRVPFVRWFRTECDYNAMVMDLLQRTYSTCQLLQPRIQPQECVVAHRSNFLMGIGKRGNQVNVINFSLTKKFRDPKMHLHIPYRENKNSTGTARYTLINTHLGVEPIVTILSLSPTFYVLPAQCPSMSRTEGCYQEAEV
jgi:casein kinase I homolog HRR25